MTLVEVVAYLLAPVGGLTIGLVALWLHRRSLREAERHAAE
jgi:hypothetical protein